MNKKGEMNILNDILDYCQKRGYLESIKKQTRQTKESERFEKLDIEYGGLEILDAIHCILDKNRTRFFIKEIEKEIKRDDLVLEAGVGTGIFSFVAAAKGAFVSGLEINKQTLKLANDIKKYLKNRADYKKKLRHNPIFLNTDALKYRTIQKFDCIISENIYTGMFYEKQVQIMNHLIQFLKPGGISIPEKMISFLALCETDKNLFDSEKSSLVVVNEIKPGISKSYRLLSSLISYNTLRFSRRNEEKINFNTLIKAKKSGVINGIYIKANIHMPSGSMIRGSETTFFGNDIIIPIGKSIKVRKDDNLKFSLSYKCGDSPKNTHISIKK